MSQREMRGLVWWRRHLEYGEKNAFKDTGVGWLLLNCIDALNKDNETWRVADRQLIADMRTRGHLWY